MYGGLLLGSANSRTFTTGNWAVHRDRNFYPNVTKLLPDLSVDMKKRPAKFQSASSIL